MSAPILIADDEPGVRESLAEVLRDAGYDVATAVDGSAALRAIEERDFAVVVTDIRIRAPTASPCCAARARCPRRPSSW